MNNTKSQSYKLSAGDFTNWLKEITLAQKTTRGMDVPCNTCNACCRSSYFIHIQPEEKETLHAIPKELLFPAPGMPKGHFVMGYDKNGFCPMFKENKCSIYNNRPLTCRNYDCRVFSVTGLKPEDDSKKEIVLQSDRWQFSFHTDNEKKILSALKNTALFLQSHADKFPVGFVPRNTTQQALLAIKVHKVFLDTPFLFSENDKKIIQNYVEKIKRTLSDFDDVN